MTRPRPSYDADRDFHRKWLGFAQPIEGLVFSIPVLAEAQIAPAARSEITTELRALLVETPQGLALRTVEELFSRFLGYDAPGMLVPRAALRSELSFYAPDGRQEIRPSFAIARGPFEAPADDPFAAFDTPAPPQAAVPKPDSPYVALVWDLGDDAQDPTALELDSPEDATGPWRYAPTAKFERLLRWVGVPIGFISNRRHLRLVYAPPNEATSHLTFRFDSLAQADGRPLVLALELLFHARRTYRADPHFTFEGLLAESRKRQGEVTEKLAEQVFEAVERLLQGFESAATRDAVGRLDWLSAAMEAGQVYEGVLNAILRLVFLLYAEDRSLLPVAHPTYAAHLSVLGLYERLTADAGAHPESMHQRYGGYGALVSLFRAIYFGVHHGDLHLPPRQGRLFDPSAFPFLEGGMPDWTAAVNLPEDRAAVRLPTIDDGTLYDVLHRLIVLDGQRISYRDLSVEQIGAVYESLMGYAVKRIEGPAVRLGKLGFWVEMTSLRDATKNEREKILDERCGLSKTAIHKALEAVQRAAMEESDDDALADALLELAGTHREREHHRARDAQLVLQPTASRRSTGSHYTPRSLSEKVVGRTLEPILACLGAAPAAKQILELKVCDPAMGSGAFLVEACRFLGEAVVAAWRRSGELPAMIEAHGNALLHAKRLVAQRCLYGVDKNAAAVELAKLSLWLETLSSEMPFTFLDHVLRHGDSLVGLDVAQLRSFHWAPQTQLPTVATLVDRALAEVKEHRDAIQALAGDESDESQREKRRLLELAEQAMERVRLVADVCVGAFFSEQKAKARAAERDRRLVLVEAYLAGNEAVASRLEDWAAAIRTQHPPFHWQLELPEVFFSDRPDPLQNDEVNRAAYVDAFVGNPPFMGVAFITERIGEAYVDWLHETYTGVHGKFDLCALFFRRTAALLGTHGTIGLVATNTISQGDTRVSGLRALLSSEGFSIYEATRSMPWPGDAAVTVAIVHLAKGAAIRRSRAPCLDGRSVEAINSRLRASPERADPVPMVANDGCAFIGSYVLGMGFVLTPEQRAELIDRASRNVERIFPFIGGQEVNTHPTQLHDRYVVSFGKMDLDEAAAWPDLLALVRERVKPERDVLRDTASSRSYKKYWWQFARSSTNLGAALETVPRCLVNAVVSKHLIFSYQPTNRIFSHKLCVFPLPAWTSFAVLQSRVHTSWAWMLCSTMRDAGINYSPTDGFDTFAFPHADPRIIVAALEDIGQRLYETRAVYMVDTQCGLTETYNCLKDPECDDEPVITLRRLHEDMDRAVLRAYGWQKIVVPPFCPATPMEEAAVDTFQDQVIDHLFVLNAERAAEESRLGGTGKKPGGVKAANRGGKKSKTSAGQGGLF